MLPSSLPSARSWLSVLALVLWVTAASAQPNSSPPTARLEVQEGLACGSRPNLVARVHARAPLVQFVDDGTTLGIRARFGEIAAGQFEGVLVLSPPGATPTTRRVVARSCAEAVDAVALIIAVTLGQASPEGDPGDQPIGPTETGASGTTAAATDPTKSETGTADAPKPPPPAGTPDASDPGQPDDTEPPSEPGSASHLTIEAHLGAEAVVGPAPEAMPGALLYALVALDGDRVFSPGAALGITRALRTGMVTPGGTADFTLDAMTIDLCPLRFGPSFIDVRPCAAALLGRLTVEGRDTLNAPGEIQRPFYVLGGSVLVAGRFGWILEPSLRAALGANLWRDSFAFTPNVFHEVPPLTLSVSLGFGVRVP